MRYGETYDLDHVRPKRRVPLHVQDVIRDYKNEHLARLTMAETANLLRVTVSAVNHLEIQAFSKMFMELENDLGAREYAQDLLFAYDRLNESRDEQRLEIQEKLQVIYGVSRLNNSLVVSSYKARRSPNTKFTFGKV